MTRFIRLLGPAEISHDDQPIRLKGHKALALLVTGQAQTRQHLVDLLFDEAARPPGQPALGPHPTAVGARAGLPRGRPPADRLQI